MDILFITCFTGSITSVCSLWRERGRETRIVTCSSMQFLYISAIASFQGSPSVNACDMTFDPADRSKVILCRFMEEGEPWNEANSAIHLLCYSDVNTLITQQPQCLPASLHLVFPH